MHTRTYKVYVKKILICQGPIDYVAEALFVSIPTARSYIYSGGNKRLKIVALPILYEASVDGTVIMRGSCEDIACEMGVKADSVRRAVREHRTCNGYDVRKFIYQYYMMSDDERRRLLEK